MMSIYRSKGESTADYKARLEQEVHPDDRSFIEAVKNQFTITNFGHPWPETSHWHELCESGTERMVEAEFKSWTKHAKAMLATVKRNGLPLTLENARKAWDRQIA